MAESNNENAPKSAAQLAAEGDKVAQEYLRWVQLRRNQENLRAKLATTADVPDKYRDPSFVEAKEDYTGSPSDIARRALEATAVPGNMIKAAIKEPTDPDLTRVDQVANAIKAATGPADKAFREQRILGADLMPDNMSEQDKAILGTAVDIGADLLGGAGVAKGAQSLGRAAAKVATSGKAMTAKAANAIDKALPKSANTMGSMDFPAVQANPADNAALFELAEKQQLLKKLREAEAVDAYTAHKNAAASRSAKSVEDARAKAQEAAEQYKQAMKARALEKAPKDKDVLSAVDTNKMVKELDEVGREARESEELLNRLSGAVDQPPTVDSRASEILAEKMSKAYDDLMPPASAPVSAPAPMPVPAAVPAAPPTQVLTPNTPLTSKQLIKGLEKFGTSDTAVAVKSAKEEAKRIIAERLKAAKGNK